MSLPSVNAPVKSAWASKVNWLQVAAAGATFATAAIGAAHLPPDQTAKAVAAVAAVGQVLTIIVRTFYSPSVISNSTGA